MGTGTLVKYISFGSFILYESVTHDPMIPMTIKLKKKNPSLQNGLFKRRMHSEPLENHPFFKKRYISTRDLRKRSTKISTRLVQSKAIVRINTL